MKKFKLIRALLPVSLLYATTPAFSLTEEDVAKYFTSIEKQSRVLCKKLKSWDSSAKYEFSNKKHDFKFSCKGEDKVYFEFNSPP